jgi:hypothetical protein
MKTWLSRGALGAVVLIGITVKWSPFSSTIYPYTISQPSTFKHQPATTPSGQQFDYFFADGLGSFTTNVNITAQRGNKVAHELAVFRSEGASKPKQDGWLRVMGHNLRLNHFVTHGLAGTWIEERVTFVAGGYTWVLTASYDPRYKNLLPTMLRMLGSFKLR